MFHWVITICQPIFCSACRAKQLVKITIKIFFATFLNIFFKAWIFTNKCWTIYIHTAPQDFWLILLIIICYWLEWMIKANCTANCFLRKRNSNRFIRRFRIIILRNLASIFFQFFNVDFYLIRNILFQNKIFVMLV